MRIGVLASHEGTTLQAVVDARAAGIPTHHLSSQTYPEPAALDAAIAGALVEHGVTLVVLAGYMKKLGPQTLARFRSRIVNTHPALLPKFGGAGMYGLHVHRAVLAAGEVKTGASVHLVDEEYDTGPVLAQCELPVLDTDTPEGLAERVQQHEWALLVDVLARIVDGRLRLPS